MPSELQRDTSTRSVAGKLLWEGNVEEKVWGRSSSAQKKKRKKEKRPPASNILEEKLRQQEQIGSGLS